jgi:hypothetical protein
MIWKNDWQPESAIFQGKPNEGLTTLRILKATTTQSHRSHANRTSNKSGITSPDLIIKILREHGDHLGNSVEMAQARHPPHLKHSGPPVSFARRSG